MLKALFWSVFVSIAALAFIPTYAPLPAIISVSDILNHFAAFFTLYLLHAAAYPLVWAKQRAGLLLGYGFFIEAVQYYLPSRHASAKDIAVDAAAILFASLLYRFYRRRNPAVL